MERSEFLRGVAGRSRFGFPLKGLAVAAIVGISACLAGGCAGEKTAAGLPSGPHPIVILSIDGLRSAGETGTGTPNLDALASESVVFDGAFAQAPDPAPSLASVLTGFYPGTHGVLRTGDELPGAAWTLAEVLSASGFETAAFVTGDGVTQDLGFAQGFDVFDARTAGGLADVGPSALRWMREREKRNFLLVVEGSDPLHAASGYGEAVARADRYLGEFLREFRELGLDRRATLVVLSPCGADLGEHGLGDGPSIHSPVTHVPLQIRFPGGFGARVADEYVELVDVPATLLEIVGVPAPANLHGRTLLPVIRGEGKPPYVSFGESPHRGGQRFVALGGYRLIRSDQAGRSEVYLLAEDPLETKDLAASEPQKAGVLESHLEAWRKLVEATSLDPNRKPAPLDDATLERLKSLGYVQ